MVSYFLICFFVCFFKSLSASEHLEKHPSTYYAQFYVFDVGQGNSQLVIYPGQKIGFLYDAGSSSYQKHVKFSQIGEMEIFLERKVERRIEEDEEGPARQKKRLSNDAFENTSDHSQSDSIPISTTSNDRKNATSISIASIKEILTASELDHLFVFLSHADKDHISLLSAAHDIIPDSLNTIIFACGNFLTESQDVKNFYAYVLSKPNISLFLPYSWDRKTTAQHISAIQNAPDIIQGDFFNFITRAKEENFYRGNEIQEHKGEDIFTEQLLNKVEDLKDKLFIWGINISGSVPNTQSSVISFKVSSDTSLILTGDSTQETFSKIKSVSEANNVDKNQILGSSRILVIPHHGSEENISKDMIHLFQPNLAIISAANGIQYSHPNRKVYEWLMTVINEPKYDLIAPLNEIIFLGEYTPGTNQEDYYDRNRKSQNKNYAALKNGEAKIISTNYSGTIKYEDGEFFRTFSPITSIDENLYTIDLKNRVAENLLEEGRCYLAIKDKKIRQIFKYPSTIYIDFSGCLFYRLSEILE